MFLVFLMFLVCLMFMFLIFQQVPCRRYWQRRSRATQQCCGRCRPPHPPQLFSVLHRHATFGAPAIHVAFGELSCSRCSISQYLCFIYGTYRLIVLLSLFPVFFRNCPWPMLCTTCETSITRSPSTVICRRPCLGTVWCFWRRVVTATITNWYVKSICMVHVGGTRNVHYRSRWCIDPVIWIV